MLRDVEPANDTAPLIPLCPEPAPQIESILVSVPDLDVSVTDDDDDKCDENLLETHNVCDANVCSGDSSMVTKGRSDICFGRTVHHRTSDGMLYSVHREPTLLQREKDRDSSATESIELKLSPPRVARLQPGKKCKQPRFKSRKNATQDHETKETHFHQRGAPAGLDSNIGNHKCTAAKRCEKQRPSQAGGSSGRLMRPEPHSSQVLVKRIEELTANLTSNNMTNTERIHRVADKEGHRIPLGSVSIAGTETRYRGLVSLVEENRGRREASRPPHATRIVANSGSGGTPTVPQRCLHRTTGRVATERKADGGRTWPVHMSKVSSLPHRDTAIASNVDPYSWVPEIQDLAVQDMHTEPRHYCGSQIAE
eukprot:m.139902 g.139902  ORF g.139902 m.139902 type:complete len:367 (-) comp17645_c0_seq2:79-1179(-)